VRPVDKRDLDAMPVGARIRAGHPSDDARHERVVWVKLASRRWQIADGPGVTIGNRGGVSSHWLAANRSPREIP
jgi:hypothetical protein